MMAALEEADAAHLMDVPWMEGCPLLEEGREHPRFRAVHARVLERAAAVNALLTG